MIIKTVSFKKSSTYDSKRVEKYSQILNGEYTEFENAGDTLMIYQFDNRGEYSIGWVVTYKNGLEIYRTSDKNIDTIWWYD